MPFIKTYLDADFAGGDDDDPDAWDRHLASIPFVYDANVERDRIVTLEGDARALVDALRASGATRLRFRYDGGDDEGFSAAVSVRLADGNVVPVAQVDARLAVAWPADATEVVVSATPLPPPSLWQRLWRRPSRPQHWTTQRRDAGSAEQRLRWAFESLAQLAAEAIAGEGFGTGEYQLYGEGELDLQTLRVADDPAAPPPPPIAEDA